MKKKQQHSKKKKYPSTIFIANDPVHIKLAGFTVSNPTSSCLSLTHSLTHILYTQTHEILVNSPPPFFFFNVPQSHYCYYLPSLAFRWCDSAKLKIAIPTKVLPRNAAASVSTLGSPDSKHHDRTSCGT